MAGFRDADGLTAKQAKFAEKLADGESQAEAYRIAYDASGMAPETIHSHASRLAARDTVRARVNAIAEERMRLIEARGISDRAKVVKLLRAFAEDDARPDHVRLRAVELWGKTCGAFVEVIEDRRERPAAAVAVELERRLGALLSAAAPQVTVIDMLPERVNDADGDDMGSTASDATAMDDEPLGGV
jgi:phage terminase small subunit